MIELDVSATFSGFVSGVMVLEMASELAVAGGGGEEFPLGLPPLLHAASRTMVMLDAIHVIFEFFIVYISFIIGSWHETGSCSGPDSLFSTAPGFRKRQFLKA